MLLKDISFSFETKINGLFDPLIEIILIKKKIKNTKIMKIYLIYAIITVTMMIYSDHRVIWMKE